MSVLLDEEGNAVPTADKNSYYQCILYRELEDESREFMIGWIEAHGARAGYQVEILEDGQLWTVEKAYGPARTIAEIREKQKKDRGSLPSIKRKKK